MRKIILGVSTIMGLTLVACTTARMPDRTDGAAFFAENCVSCHGADARLPQALRMRPSI